MFDTFMLVAIAAGIMIGGVCAYLGNFTLLKNMTFISIALSEMAALGVALGFLIHFFPDAMAFAVTLLGVIYFWKRGSSLQAAHEGIIGLLYAGAAAVGIILVSLNPSIEAKGIDLVSGNLLYCTGKDLVMIGVVLAIIAVIHFIFFKEFLFVSFDSETASAEGLNASLWDFLLLLTIGLCISFSIKLAGVLFVFASLVIPGMTAMTLFCRVRNVFIGSVAIVIISVLIGVALSYHLDVPTSPAIICVYTAFFLVSGLLKAVYNKAL